MIKMMGYIWKELSKSGNNFCSNKRKKLENVVKEIGLIFYFMSRCFILLFYGIDEF